MSIKKRNIKGHDYLGPIVFKVLEKDAFNRPTKVEVGYDDSTFHIEKGTEFFTGYISATAVEDAKFPKAKA